MNVTQLPTGADSPTPPTAAAEQLSLLPPSDLPLQFRLDEETRRRGLRHVAEIQRMLAERRAARTDETRARHLTPRRAA